MGKTDFNRRYLPLGVSEFVRKFQLMYWIVNLVGGSGSDHIFDDIS